MFLLLYGHHAGWAPTWRLHKSYINLGETLFRIMCKWITTQIDLNLGEVVYIPIIFYTPQFLDAIYWMVGIFTFDGVTLETSHSTTVNKITSIYTKIANSICNTNITPSNCSTITFICLPPASYIITINTNSIRLATKATWFQMPPFSSTGSTLPAPTLELYYTNITTYTNNTGNTINT